MLRRNVLEVSLRNVDWRSKTKTVRCQIEFFKTMYCQISYNRSTAKQCSTLDEPDIEIYLNTNLSDVESDTVFDQK